MMLYAGIVQAAPLFQILLKNQQVAPSPSPRGTLFDVLIAPNSSSKFRTHGKCSEHKTQN